MQTEKRDVILHFALRARSLDGSMRGNEQCQIIAVKNIEGFQSERPNINQQSYPEKMVAWNYQQDAINFIQPLVYAAFITGNVVKTADEFRQKYPKQVTDWSKELR